MEDKDIRKIISQLRESLGLTQEELADKLDVSFTTLNRWENARIVPRAKAKDKILALIKSSELDISDSGKKRKRKTSKEDVLSTKAMEQMLWNAACSVRGEKDAPKFKDYILPLIFIKRLSDVFDDEVKRLTEKYGDVDTTLSLIEADHSLVRFYIPEEARWAIVSFN